MAPDRLGAPLEELQFLARSPNRITVLETLTRGPIDRYELEETTGVTRATLGRILDDLEGRRWILEEDGSIEATQLGTYVSENLQDLLARFAPVPELNEVAHWLPPNGFDFDLGRLAGATIVRASKSDAVAPTSHIAIHVREADRVRLASYSLLPRVMTECFRGILDGNLTLESVLDGRALEGLGADPELLDQAGAIVSSNRAEVYVTHEEIPSAVFLVDDVALLCLSGGHGAPQAVIESDDPAVRSWAEARIDEHRRSADRLDRSLFTG